MIYQPWFVQMVSTCVKMDSHAVKMTMVMLAAHFKM